MSLFDTFRVSRPSVCKQLLSERICKMGIKQIICVLILFTVCCIGIYSEVIDVDIGLSNNSFTYTADLDSQQLEYRCVSFGTSDVLTWKHGVNNFTNPLNAYEFYGVSSSVGNYSIGCYSGTNKLGEMELTIKDNANFTVEYSGKREVYPFSSGMTQTATIPLDTSDIEITCEVSSGVISTPSNQFTPLATNPNVTISLNESTIGLYQCYRVISNNDILILTLNIEKGGAPAPTQTSTATSTTTTTTPEATTTVPVTHNTVPFNPPSVPSVDTTETTINHTQTTNGTTPVALTTIFTVTICCLCCSCLVTCLTGIINKVSKMDFSTMDFSPTSSSLRKFQDRNQTPEERNQTPRERTRVRGYHELQTCVEMETLDPPVKTSDRLRSLKLLLADIDKQRYTEFSPPYERLGVVLRDGSLITAFYIPLGTNANGFIATPAPESFGVEALWRLIEEKEISCVVQLANVVESGRRRCEQYWPGAKIGVLDVSGVEVELSGVTEYRDWCRREITVIKKNKCRTVTQFHFTEWSSGTFPQDTSGLMHMLRSVKEFHDLEKTICVICPDGGGRSCVFILLYSALCLLESGAGVSLNELLAKMRKKGPMVRTMDEYEYSSRCLQELTFGDTSVPLPRFLSFYQENTSSDGTRFSGEFQQLDFVTKESLSGEKTYAPRPEYISEDSPPSSLPFNRNRVLLRSRGWHGGNYINASYFELGGVRNRLIGTLNPSRHTLRVFLQLLWQTKPDKVVMLESQIGYDKIMSGVSHYSCYWPEEGLQMETDNFTVSALSSERSGGLITQKLSLSNQMEEGTHEFSHFVLLDWEESGVPTNHQSVMALARECVQSRSTAPLVVHCRDCVGMSGVFLVSCRALWQMRQEERVDIFSLVKRARCERQKIICTQEQYSSCYRLVETEVRGSE